jgi:pilus assembly protein CpaC
MLDSLMRRLLAVAMALTAAAFIDGGAARADEVPPAVIDEAPPPAPPRAVAPAPILSRSVKLALNRSLVVDLPRDARDILVSNPAIADAVIRTSRRIYLTGIAVGQANIIVFDKSGRQIVTLDLEVERDNSLLQTMLQRLIPDSDIAVEVVSDNIVLSGTVKNAGDSRKAQDIANIFANGGANAQPAPSTGASAGGGAGAGNAVAVSVGPAAPTPTSAVVNLLTIEGEDQVHLKVTVAEVNRNSIKQLGVDWDAQNLSVGNILFSGVGPLGTFTNNALTVNGPLGNSLTGAQIGDYTTPKIGGEAGKSINAQHLLGATLQALERNGLFRILAEPTLTAISGETASFLAGGEFPVPTGTSCSGPNGGPPCQLSVEFKPFGVSLSFTPVVLSEGRISLRVKTEVSELTQEGAVQIQGTVIPALKVRRAETTMELPSGGAMVMGGLLRDDVRQSIGGLPGLTKLPVLGALFRSRDFQRSETELVIMVTPYLVKPVPLSALARPDDGFAPPSDPASIFLGRLNRVYGVKGQPAPAGSYQGRYGFILE